MNPPDLRFEKVRVRIKRKMRVRFKAQLNPLELGVVSASGMFTEPQLVAIGGGLPISDYLRRRILRCFREDADRAHTEALASSALD